EKDEDVVYFLLKTVAGNIVALVDIFIAIVHGRMHFGGGGDDFMERNCGCGGRGCDEEAGLRVQMADICRASVSHAHAGHSVFSPLL
ncbi:unnamed protein product, partial [Sphacelaria rigidula]